MFNLPDCSADHPGALFTSLDKPGLDPDTLWMHDLSARIPDTVTNAIKTPTPFSARVSRLVKYKANAQPTNGYPTYNPQGPAPSIMHYRPHKTFFGAPFAIWTGDQAWRATKACRPIRPHELWNLFGFHPTLADELARAPPDIGLRHARATPGKNGLSALFHCHPPSRTQQPPPQLPPDTTSRADNACPITASYTTDTPGPIVFPPH